MFSLSMSTSIELCMVKRGVERASPAAESPSNCVECYMFYIIYNYMAEDI